MKVLVTYYSLQGNSRCVGESIARLLNADVEEIKTVMPVDPHRYMENHWGGNSDRPVEDIEIMTPGKDPDDYDLIVIGTPVWAWAPAPPVQTYLKKMGIRGKKVALYACSEGEAGKTFQLMKQLLNGNSIISEEEFINPRKDMNGVCVKKAHDWARALLDGASR